MTESRSASTYGEEESFSTYGESRTQSYEGGESVSTYNGTATKSRDDSSASRSSSSMSKHEASKIRRNYELKDKVSVDESSEWSEDVTVSTETNTNGKDRETDKQLDQFDRLVEQVLANDPSFNDIVLDNRSSLIGSLYGSEDLWNALVGNTFIDRLSIRGCNMTDEEAASLSMALMDNTTVTHIWLGYNVITSEGVEYLIAALESNQTIVYLELDGNVDVDPGLEEEVRSILKPRENAYESEPEIDVVDVGQVMKRVRNNDETLTELNLSSMGVGTRPDALTMFDTLAGNSYIKIVDLSQNDIDDDCVSSISLALFKNRSITHLNLADNAISSEGAEYLIGTLNTNTTLIEINLSGNHIDNIVIDKIGAILNERQGSSRVESGLEATVARLEVNDSDLVELNLDGIDLDRSAGTDALIDALAKNTVVTKLWFDNTYVNDILAEALSLVLSNNHSITHVSLRHNDITSEGCECLLGMLDSNLSIISLDLSGNLVDEHLMDEIDVILSQRKCQVGSMSLSVLLQRVIGNDRTLTELELDNRPDDMMSHEIEAIIEGLARNNFVTKISLCNNDLDDNFVASLSMALVYDHTITHLLLSGNHITSDGCEYLLGLLDSNETIIFLDLRGNLIDEHLMNEIDEIVSQRQIRAGLPQIV